MAWTDGEGGIASSPLEKMSLDEKVRDKMSGGTLKLLHKFC
jgi:hypothetical protein